MNHHPTYSAGADVATSVTRLVEVCRDSQYGFEMAAAGVDEPVLRAELLQYSCQRKEFAAEINHALRELGEEQIDHGTVAGALHRGWLKLKEAITNKDAVAVLSECRLGEEVALDAYRKAIVAELPPVMLGLANSQLHAIARVHDRIVSLLNNARTHHN